MHKYYFKFLERVSNDFPFPNYSFSFVNLVLQADIEKYAVNPKRFIVKLNLKSKSPVRGEVVG